MRRREFVALFGGAAAWPLEARAQQRSAIPRIAIVHPSDPVTSLSVAGGFRWRAFFTELQRLGFFEGRNLQVERHSGEGRSDRYAELAKEVADRNPDAVVTNSTRMASHFMTASRTVPVVAFTGDPVAGGITTSLAKPSGNVTGVITDAGSEVLEKNFALLKELVPNITRVGVLVPRAFFDGPMEPHLQRAAQRTGVRTVNVGLESPINRLEYERVFAMLALERADALVVLPAPENILNAQTIVELAARDRLPAIYRIRDFSEAGGLMAYAIDTPDLYRRAAGQVAAILKGAKVNEVPFYQATTFKLIINLKAAKGLGITVPPSLLARADEVVE
jgi:putative ABC transport system substrate-binding protein